METMKRPFLCSCGKQFSNGKAMGGHKKVHSQKKTRRSLMNNLKGGAAICTRTDQIAVKGNPDIMPPKKRYFCSICGVYFQSHRSLGAHSGHHARKKLPTYKVDESSSSDDDHNDEDYDVNEDEDDEDSEAEKRVVMVYKCPYNCERVFRSGKALGGHKRHCTNRAAADRREAAIDEDRNGGGNNNRLGFDLNEVPDSDN